MDESKTTPSGELKEKLKVIKRGIDSVLIDAALKEEPINPNVLICIKRDIESAIAAAWSDYAPF